MEYRKEECAEQSKIGYLCFERHCKTQYCNNIRTNNLNSTTGSQLFHPSTQKCENYDCNMPTCSSLMLKHSTLVKGKCKKGSLEGARCTVKCNQGFTPALPFEIMCSGGKWLVDGDAPRCTPVDCGEKKIKNAVVRK